MAVTIHEQIRDETIPFIKQNASTFWGNLGENKVTAVAKFAIACSATSALGLCDCYPATMALVSTGIAGAGLAIWLTEAPNPKDLGYDNQQERYGRPLETKELRPLIDNLGRIDGTFHIRSVLAGILAGNSIILSVNLLRKLKAGSYGRTPIQRLMTQVQWLLLLANNSLFTANLVWTCTRELNFAQPREEIQADRDAPPTEESELSQRMKKMFTIMGEAPGEQALSSLLFAAAAGLTLGVGLRTSYPRLYMFGMSLFVGLGFIWKEDHLPSPGQMIADRISYGYVRHYDRYDSWIDENWQIGGVGIRSIGFGILSANLALYGVTAVRHFMHPGRSLIPGTVLALPNAAALVFSLWYLSDPNN